MLRCRSTIWLRCMKLRGRYPDAEPLYKQSLAILEKILGKDHPNIATSLGNLAELYRVQGRYADAEPLFKQAIEIEEKAYGPIISGLQRRSTTWRGFTAIRVAILTPSCCTSGHYGSENTRLDHVISMSRYRSVTWPRSTEFKPNTPMPNRCTSDRWKSWNKPSVLIIPT